MAQRSAALVRAAQEWRASFDAIGDPMAIVKGGGCEVVRANTAFARAAGVSVSNLAGLRCSDHAFGSLPCPTRCAMPANGAAERETTFADYLTYLRALPAAERARRLPHAGAGPASLQLGEHTDGTYELTVQAGGESYRAREGELLHYQGRAQRAAQDWLRFPGKPAPPPAPSVPAPPPAVPKLQGGLRGTWLRRQRQRLGLSEQDLWKALQVHWRTLTTVERHNRLIPAAWLPALERLGMTAAGRPEAASEPRPRRAPAASPPAAPAARTSWACGPRA